jgi:hypothetical protein
MDIKKGEEAAAPSISRLTLSMAEALFAFFSLPRLLLARRGIGLFIIYAHCWSSISSSSSFLSLWRNERRRRRNPICTRPTPE